MADSIAFSTLCETLEAASSLDRLEARGTVRLALKQAGLEARSVSASQLTVVIEKIFPAELESRGVDLAILPQLVNGLSAVAEEPNESPETIFGRLAG